MPRVLEVSLYNSQNGLLFIRSLILAQQTGQVLWASVAGIRFKCQILSYGMPRMRFGNRSYKISGDLISANRAVVLGVDGCARSMLCWLVKICDIYDSKR